jgi:hypothetical protein
VNLLGVSVKSIQIIGQRIGIVDGYVIEKVALNISKGCKFFLVINISVAAVTKFSLPHI